MEKVFLKDKEFHLFIPKNEINIVLDNLAKRLNSDLEKKDVMFLAILNGAFMFAADIIRKVNFQPQISFLKMASYSGSSSSGKVKQLIGLNEDLQGKTVVVLEDIVDTGVTLDNTIRQIKGFGAEDVKICSLLFKPSAYKGNIPIDYIGKEISNDFVVGYGLDYDGLGRYLSGIYKIKS